MAVDRSEWRSIAEALCATYALADRIADEKLSKAFCGQLIKMLQ